MPSAPQDCTTRYPLSTGMEEDSLEKGSAFAETSGSELQAEVSPDDWPAYRHDSIRTGTTKNTVPAVLVRRWEARIGARAIAPVIAAGIVFLADVDGHAGCKQHQHHGDAEDHQRVSSPCTAGGFGLVDQLEYSLNSTGRRPCHRWSPAGRGLADGAGTSTLPSIDNRTAATDFFIHSPVPLLVESKRRTNDHSLSLTYRRRLLGKR